MSQGPPADENPFLGIVFGITISIILGLLIAGAIWVLVVNIT